MTSRHCLPEAPPPNLVVSGLALSARELWEDTPGLTELARAL